ncbi:unnamed protein product [Medioppia subpectinata]|uniref:Vacuolar protein sorting-associated protein 33A n=1 Tax=Medioppia subpectinata TaxID=1979941 RepID=A0A7R9KHV9_9ACAR|nr:unnamed protein product [Medioppia subpectinata]CAG2103714.1 unnamed protein product [Medioppia subpectinata]
MIGSNDKTMSHLSTGRLNVNHMKELAKHELLECLDKCMGSKAIVWDHELVGIFGLVADYLLLKEHQVIQMFELRPGRLPAITATHVIYLTRTKLSLMDTIADNLLNEDKKPSIAAKNGREFHVIFVPRRSILCERKLQVLGVYGNLNTISEYGVELFALDSDVLSMEWQNCFQEIYVDNDYTSLFHSAKALMTLQTLYGIIPNVFGLGKSAKVVFDLMTKMRKELSGSEPQITPQIDQLLLIDRSVDLLTPLMTQTTYEGLLDEMFGITHTTIKVPPEKFVHHNSANDGQTSEETIEGPTEAKQFHLNSSEELFVKLRDISFKSVGPTLRTSAKALTQQYDERHNAKTVRQIRQFVDKLPALQSARKSQSNHTSMAELIKEVTDEESFYETIQTEHQFVNCIETDKTSPYIEDCIAKVDPLVKILRLICIQSFANNGLKSKVIEFYKREILQTYGYQHILTFNNLEKVGLIRNSGTYSHRVYNVLRKTLKLTVQGVNELSPTDIAYVHSGYAPLSVRLAQYLDHPGWRAITDVLKTLPEPTIEETQHMAPGLRKRRNSGASIQTGVIEDQKLIAVFFLGGCTYTEISALRFLSQKEGFNADFIVITTNIINGKTFLQSLTHLPLK